MEWAHHRALVAEARTNLRREISENRKAAEEDLKQVHEDQARMQKNLQTERSLRDHPADFHHGNLQFTFEWSSMDEAAWNKARDTGALSYMAYGDVQRYAELYGQQSIVNTAAIDVFREQTRAISPIYTADEVSKMSPAEPPASWIRQRPPMSI